jgi:hypothetical protein
MIFVFFIRPQTTGTIAISLAVSAEYPDVCIGCVGGRRRFKQPESGGRVIGYAIAKTMGQLKLMKKPYKTLILLSACFALSSCSAANSSSKATGLITKITCQSSSS